MKSRRRNRSRVDEDVDHPHGYLEFIQGFDILFIASIEVAHVGNVDFEGALYFLVLCEN